MENDDSFVLVSIRSNKRRENEENNGARKPVALFYFCHRCMEKATPVCINHKAGVKVNRTTWFHLEKSKPNQIGNFLVLIKNA